MFPEKWCIKITEENLQTVGNWYNKHTAGTSYSEKFRIGCYYSSHVLINERLEIANGVYYANNILEEGPTVEFPEITYEQFKKYVLKENVNSLIKLIKKLNKV